MTNLLLLYCLRLLGQSASPDLGLLQAEPRLQPSQSKFSGYVAVPSPRQKRNFGDSIAAGVIFHLYVRVSGALRPGTKMVLQFEIIENFFLKNCGFYLFYILKDFLITDLWSALLLQ